ncbi:tetratricopeptide repeat protein 31 isoform X1 [Zootoca vivipara]|uniref:tetratricopeptide repeat protein 31 isoform X1 n=1 Tax=Zootoca vivipara TaxID=8524 RepID=UPI00293BA89B|nr:tetratricopeptide repeat protein 31 isoform X1 [Zootoca vivipara]
MPHARPEEALPRPGCPREAGPAPGGPLDLLEQRWQQVMAQQLEEPLPYLVHEANAEAGLICSDVDDRPCWFCEASASEDYSDDDWGSDEEELEEERAQNGSPATFCGFKKSFLCKPSAFAPPASGSQDSPLLGISLPRKQQLTAEEAARNGAELVAEEERIKKKAEKKRMKKKRQKDRKKQEKRDQELMAKSIAQADEYLNRSGVQGCDCLAAIPSALGPALPNSEESSTQDLSENMASPGRSPSRSTEEETEEELDLTSTFVSKARLKVGSKAPPQPLPRKEKAAQPGRKESEVKEQQQVPKSGLQMTPVEQSMVLADCGNETAKQGGYQEAVLLFTEAVKLNPREYRFFGNRSFCYERLRCYAEALRDAQVALSLHPGWPKGLFRKGKALMGLKRYAEAVRTFEELLHFDGFRGDAAIQLEKCRVQLLLENGFGHYPPEWNVRAREASSLPAGEQSGGQPVRSISQAGGHLASLTITNSQGKGLPPLAVQAPVRERFPVWVGNLTATVTQEVLLRYFQPFGPIDSIRCLPRRFCAFVNYACREAAEKAYVALQGAEVEGCHLVLQLKHPVHATPPLVKAPGGGRQHL